MTREAVLLLVLAATGAALVAVGLATAARPAGEVPSRDGYFDRWRVLHGGYEPRGSSIWVRGWLTMVYLLARPLARRGVQPDVVTLASAWTAGLVWGLAELGGRWWLAAGLLVVASGLLDNLDGGVAVLQDRATPWGYVLDSAVDRGSDTAFLLAVVAAGCPAPLAVGVGFAVFLLEYVRARAGNAGGDGVGRITVAERPTRVLVLAPTLLACGAVPDRADVPAAVGALLLLALTVVALVQLTVAVRRQLLALPPA